MHVVDAQFLKLGRYIFGETVQKQTLMQSL